MVDEHAIRRVHNLAIEIAEQNARLRELAAEALKVLSQPVPDTFLGRKTQEPFPMTKVSRD